ncbi:MAG TPA: response regulator [Terriglobales bacterium]|nr:response regulator [Terriglobales bacterium]
MAGFNFRILVVDDDPAVRDISSALLSSKGYEVRTARDGFEALVELRGALPDMIISDLKMPNMSGFELLSVIRRRFPQVAVIAISGEYAGTAPSGLIADAFFSKSDYSPEQLFSKIAELLEHFPLRPHIFKPDHAPVWVPRNAEGYFVVTCTECLRSFSVPAQKGEVQLREADCIFCGAAVRFLAEAQRTGENEAKAS